MRDAKIVKLLRLFPPAEYRRVREFVASPFFNTNRRLEMLLDFLLHFAPAFEHPDLTVEQALRRVFPEFHAAQGRKESIIKLSSKLFALLERYVAHRQLENDEPAQLHYLLRFYLEEHQLQAAEQSLRRLEKLVALQEETRADTFEMRYQLQKEINRIQVARNVSRGSVDFEKTDRSLEQLFIREKLEHICAMLNHQYIAKTGYHETGFPLLAEYFASKKYMQQPGIAVWFSAVQLLQHPNEANFQHLKSHLFQIDPLLDLEKKRALWACLFNASRTVFTNDEAYFQQLFELYRIQLDNHTLLVRGTLAPVLYYNIVTVALRLREVAWAVDFADQYVHLIAPEHDDCDNIRHLCAALIQFEKGRFDDALETLNQVHFNEVNGKLSERRLRLKIYFEMEMESLLADSINSFRKFLSDHKDEIPDFHLQINRHFISLISAISKLPVAEKEQAFAMLEGIREKQHLPEKNWLVLKLKTRFRIR